MIAPMAESSTKLLKNISFTIMVLALVAGAVIVLGALIKGMREHRAQHHILREMAIAD